MLNILFDLIFGKIVGLILIPIFCVFLSPYFFIKAFFGPLTYGENLESIYKKFIKRFFFTALSLNPDKYLDDNADGKNKDTDKKNGIAK